MMTRDDRKIGDDSSKLSTHTIIPSTVAARNARNAAELFGLVEHVIAVGIGVILSIAAILALAGAVMRAWDGILEWPHIRSLFAVVDRLLFVLMVIEILHTVRSALQSRELTVEPFMVVGIIAAIRRVLVVTLETSDRSEASQAMAGSALPFDHAMIELAILAILILVLAIAIHLLRRPRADHREAMNGHRVGALHSASRIVPHAHEVLCCGLACATHISCSGQCRARRITMKKMLLAAAAFAVLTASPALAESHACRFLGHSRGVGMNGPGYNAYDDYYAWTPGCYHGRPSPYAQYDQNGHIYDENLPDRW
jgi:uncharacterized membrane protein (DUF373 family)